MRIDINEKYVITSDPNQFVVSTKGVVKTDRKGTDTKEGPKAGDEYLSPVAYLSTIEQCYRWLFRSMVRECDAVGFKAVVEECRRIEQELKESIKI